MKNPVFYPLFLALLLFIVQCKTKETTESSQNDYRTVGEIVQYKEQFSELVSPRAKIEIIGEGFEWSEGPVWVARHDFLLFSDIPPNKIYKWNEGDGISLFLQPSGYTGSINRGGEVGSNGLLINAEGKLVLCQHGDRRIAQMDAPLDNPRAEFKTIVAEYEGKKLNSPNDATYDSQGNLYFTDPPYGLENQAEDTTKELEYQGVFLFKTNGQIVLLSDKLSRPNGIALSPDESFLYVANSDPKNPIWMQYNVKSDGTVDDGKVFFDATPFTETHKGLPDGLKVNDEGFIFATGPGGVLVFDLEGTHLGTIRTGQATSNVAFGPDQNTLYITADMYLLRVILKP